MLIVRFGSTCFMQTSSDMPPHKKLKTEDGEPEVVNVVTSESESEGAVDFGSDWRDRCRSLSAKYSYALKKGVLSDVKLVVGERETPFPCHRLILALGSPVFEAMFFGELAETGDTVTIPDVHPDGFQHLIRFLYTGQCVLQSVDVAFKTYFAADKYCVAELKRRCESHLCLCSVTPENVWQFFENALFLNSGPLQERCMELLKHELRSCLDQPSFLEVNHNTVESLLSLDNLNVSEERLLKNVVRWAEHQSQVAGGDSFENTLKPLLSSIRFGALTPREFVHLRRNTRLGEVLSEEDSLAIVEHLVLREAQLPDWCCTKTRRSSPLPPPPPVPEKEETRSKKSKGPSKSLQKAFVKRELLHRPSPSYSYSSSFNTSSDSSSSSSSDSSSD